MKKLITLLGVFTLLLVLAGCTGDGETTLTPPSFVGVSVDNTNPYDGTDYELYYKEKNESTSIGIVLNNPSNLEIRAIYINGYSYRYNTFSEDSTNTEIYFDMDAGDVLGLTEYTVDEIEYFDGSDTREVLVEENNEFHLYVFKDLPSVSRENYQTTQDEIFIDFDVTDVDNVIVDGSLVVKIFEGATELTSKEQELNDGFNSISFTELKTDTNYEVKVYANYDLDDTLGLREEVILFGGSFTTFKTAVPSAKIMNIVETSDSVTFDIEYTDVDNVSVPGSTRIEVFDGDTLVRTVNFNGSVEGVVLEGLFNSKEYTLVIVTNYDLRNGQGTVVDSLLAQQVFTTTAREVPEPIIEGIIVEENRILFDLIIEDDEENPIIDLSTLVAEVYVDGEYETTIFISNERVELQINDVLSGKDVLILFKATYDLNDGNGAQPDQVIGSFERTSLLNEIPSVIVHDVIVTQGYIEMDLIVLDNSDSLLGSVRAILYEVTEVDGEEIESYIATSYLGTEDEEAIFSHLIESDRNYRIKVLADYNLKDGTGNKTNQVLYTHEVTSMQPKAPASEIQNIQVYNNGMDFDVVVMDADETIIPNSIFVYVYKDGELQGAFTQSLIVGVNNISLTGLNSDYVYEVLVEVDYDVQDGSDVQEDQVLIKKDIKTTAKEIPSAVIGSVATATESITFDVFISDLDDVIEPGTLYAILYYNNVPTGDTIQLSVGDNFGLVFDDIQSDTPFKIGIVVDYDLDDGNGIIEDFNLGDFNKSTDPKFAPDAEIQNIEETTDTITFDAIITDVYNVITGTPKALLFVGDTYTGQSIDLNVGINLDMQFTNVYSNTNFVIYIVSSYDLNDGESIFVDKELTYDFAETEINEMVQGDLYDVTVGIDTITFSAVITDNDNVVTNNLRAYLYLNDVATGDYIDLVVGDNQDKVFSGLISDSEYKIELRTDFSLRDTVGEQTFHYLDAYSTSTDAYTAPDGYVTNVNQTIDTLRFDTVITDVSDTSTGQYIAVLYYEGVAEGQTAVLNEGLTQFIEFDNLYSGVDYEIRIESTYDLHDGLGDQTSYVYTGIFETESRNAPVGSASGVDVTKNEINFIFDYVDTDQTLVPNTLKVWLYDEDYNLIDVRNLYDDQVFFDVSYLLADFTVIIRVTGDYDLSNGAPVVDDGVLYTGEFTTVANKTPFASISEVQYNQNNVTFNLDISDEDSVIKDNLYVILYDNLHNPVKTVLVTELNSTIVFDNVTLNVREWYNIIVTADLDFVDGEGLQTDVVLSEKPIMQYNEVVPQAHIFDQVITVSSIEFDVVIYDNYATYVGNAMAVLYRDGVATGDTSPLVIGLNSDVSFTGLVSNGNYEVRIVLDYNNNDGTGDQLGYLVLSEDFKVLQRQLPTADIVIENVDKEYLVADITVADTDSVITGNLKAVIYKDGVATAIEQSLSVGLNDDVVFNLLQSDTSYEIKVVVDYDLQDEATVVAGEELATQEFDTLQNTLPTAVFSDVTSDTGSITFDLNIIDPDTVVTGNVIVKLYRNNVYTGTFQSAAVGDNQDMTFTNLYSDSNYYVEVSVNYDLNDGNGLKEDIVLANASTVTYPNQAPTATIGSTSTTVDSVTFSAVVVDDDSVITGNLQAVLYVNGFPTGDTLPLVVGDNIGLTFNTLYSNRQYEVQIEADYDLRDGSPAETAYELASEFDTTNAKATPNAIITNEATTNTEITLDVEVVDGDSAIVGQAKAALFLDDVATGQEVLLNVGANVGVTFTGLDYGEEYEVRILTDYNNNIGNPDIEDHQLTSTAIETQPLVTVSGIVEDIFSVSFDVTLDDSFSILDDEYLTLKIYDESNILSGTYMLEGSGTVDILHYLNDHTYRVEIEANVTGQGDVKVYELSLTVPPRVLQFVNIGEIGVNGSDISTNITIELPDPEGVISGTVTAYLYELQGGVYVQVDSQTLIDGENSVIFGTFDGTDGTAYMIRVEGTCNFNDGTGDQANYVISSRTFIYTTQN